MSCVFHLTRSSLLLHRNVFKCCRGMSYVPLLLGKKNDRCLGQINGPCSYSIKVSTSSNQRLSFGDKVIRLLGWAGGFYSRKAVLTRCANSIYEQCIDEVDYESFFEVGRMPDSFQSWFLVAQLHIWLCMARLKREEEDGKFLIRQMVNFFWKDVEERMKQLGVQSYVVSDSLKELDKEFRGLILAYEEGLFTDDRRLAGAIWRNLISEKSTTDAEGIARIVQYIRSQVKAMDATDTDVLKKIGKMNLLPLTLRIK